MINIERVKPGQVLLGREEKYDDGRWWLPEYTVIEVRDGVVVQNNRGETQFMNPEDLFTIHGYIRFLRRKNRNLKYVLREIARSVIASPELVNALNKIINF